MADGATQDTVAGWTRFYFPLDSFDCTGSIKISDLNRLQVTDSPSTASADRVPACCCGVRQMPREIGGVPLVIACVLWGPTRCQPLLERP